MSGLMFCNGDVESLNCADVCVQKSDCQPGQPGEVCCKPNEGGSFCVGQDGQFLTPSQCQLQMGPATSCETRDNMTKISWKFNNASADSLTAGMVISGNDAQYSGYMSEFCKK